MQNFHQSKEVDIQGRGIVRNCWIFEQRDDRIMTLDDYTVEEMAIWVSNVSKIVSKI